MFRHRAEKRLQHRAHRLRGMKTRLLALAAAIGGAAHAAVIIPADPAAAWKAVADRRYPSVIEVRGLAAVPGGGPEVPAKISSGAGVLIGNGLAVTTFHAVASPSANGTMLVAPVVEVLVSDAGPMEVRVIASAPGLDLAVLAMPDSASSVEAAPFATESPAQGDGLVAMGAADEAITVVGVVVSGVKGDILALASNRTLDSRYWGGPLFDARGRLAGIQLTSVGPAQAISARAIQRLLDQRAATPSSPPQP
jgi:S1-C subfamily serine protease